MTKPNFIFKLTLLFVFCFLSVQVSSAQDGTKASIEPGYDVVLQVLVGSNNAAQKSSVPASFSSIVKKINNNFSFSNYRLSNTYISRIADNGSVEFKNLSGDFTQTAEQSAPTFLDWSCVGLRDTAQNLVQIQSFRFGARVPVKTGNGVVAFENIGLTLQRVNAPKNVPTLIGTLPTTNSGENVFLVLTVKSVE